MSYFKRAVFLTSYLVNNSSRSAQRGPSVRTVANSTERETMSVIKAGGRVWNQFAHLWPLSPEGYCHSWASESGLRCRVKPFMARNNEIAVNLSVLCRSPFFAMSFPWQADRITPFFFSSLPPPPPLPGDVCPRCVSCIYLTHHRGR